MVFQTIWILQLTFLHLIFMTRVLDAENAEILFSNDDEIRRKYKPDIFTTVIGGLHSVRSLDYDYEQNRIFFIDHHEDIPSR